MHMSIAYRLILLCLSLFLWQQYLACYMRVIPKVSGLDILDFTDSYESAVDMTLL